MDTKELIGKLESLVQLDTDAVHVYDEALEHVTDDEVRGRFEHFKGEHRFHSEKLSEIIVRLGGDRPDLEVDTAGHVAEWVTAIRSRRGTEGALHAMKTAEKYHNRRYHDATTWDAGDEGVTALLRQFDADEQRHLAYIEDRLMATSAAGAER